MGVKPMTVDEEERLRLYAELIHLDEEAELVGLRLHRARSAYCRHCAAMEGVLPWVIARREEWNAVAVDLAHEEELARISCQLEEG